MISNRVFANRVIRTLSEHLATEDIEFFGSHRTGNADEYSDVDIRARIGRPLNAAFFNDLNDCIEKNFGRMTVRYDPDYRNDPQTQDLRFTLYDFPIFWRIDLVVVSDQVTSRKFPSPFPEWSITTSALWNLVWAVKYDRRSMSDAADEYMAAACDKLCAQAVRFSFNGVEELLNRLAIEDDVDFELVEKLRRALS